VRFSWAEGFFMWHKPLCRDKQGFHVSGITNLKWSEGEGRKNMTEIGVECIAFAELHSPFFYAHLCDFYSIFSLPFCSILNFGPFPSFIAAVLIYYCTNRFKDAALKSTIKKNKPPIPISITTTISAQVHIITLSLFVCARHKKLDFIIHK
jgi:hypothetical protein